ARSWVRVLVLVVVAQPVHDALFFLTAKRREIEQVVGVEQRVEAALVGRVGVEDAIAIAEEHAQPFPLAFVRPTLGLGGDGRVVVHGMVVVERHSEVVVEVGPERRQPGKRPPHARSEEHTSELQSLAYLVCRLLLEKKKTSKAVQAEDEQL